MSRATIGGASTLSIDRIYSAIISEGLREGERKSEWKGESMNKSARKQCWQHRSPTARRASNSAIRLDAVTEI